VHSADCPNVKNLLYHPEREIEVEWEGKSRELYPVVLSIETEDEPGMLARLTEAIARHHSNIRHIEAETEESGRGLIEVMVEVRDRRHLEKLHESLQALPGVLNVDRRMASGADSKP
jgi:GTP pyrophosphokinase